MLAMDAQAPLLPGFANGRIEQRYVGLRKMVQADLPHPELQKFVHGVGWLAGRQRV